MEYIPTPQQIVNMSAYEAFQLAIKKLQLVPELKIFRDQSIVKEVSTIGVSLFLPILENIKRDLSDPGIGISVLDIPSNENNSQENEAFMGTILALAISWNLMTPSLDPSNLMPFTLYTASEKNAATLANAQLKQNIPEAKLGFHNDGLLESNDIFVPQHIALYNILISYKNPGQFHWIPFSYWKEMKEFADIFGVNKKYKFNLVQPVYGKSDGGLDIHGTNTITAPLFSKNENGELLFFLNGELDTNESIYNVSKSAVDDLKRSLSLNPVRYSIAQKERRLIFLKNNAGCHARDIFENPINRMQLTRAFVRIVDNNGTKLNLCP